MKLFTTGDVLEITGLPATTFDTWCHNGPNQIVKPIDGGTGTGNHRRFTLMQVVGIAVAAEQRKTDRSCALSYVALVVKAFGDMTEEWLRKKLDEGKAHLAIVHLGKPVLAKKEYDWIDVRAIYDRVTEASKSPRRLPSVSGSGT
jgi:hypothetical protein